MSRPTLFSKELADEICSRLIEGESLRSICMSEGMPNRNTVYNWTEVNAEFLGQYTRARLFQADSLADECQDISDGLKDVADRKLAVDTRKWFAGKLNSARYGDRGIIEHVGAQPVTVLEEQVFMPQEKRT